MVTKFLRQGLLARVIVCLITVSFILGSGPIGTFAASNMKVQSAGTDNSRLEKIINNRQLNGAQNDGGLEEGASHSLRSPLIDGATNFATVSNSSV